MAQNIRRANPYEEYALSGLQEAAPWNGEGSNPDPLGLDIQAQSRAHDLETGYTGSMIAPMWTSTLEGLSQGADKVAGGPSEPGSNQITGISSQPGYFANALSGLKKSRKQ